MNYHQHTIECEKNYITRDDIEKCIVEFEKITLSASPNPVMNIVAKEFIKDIDNSLLAYLILFKKNIEEQERQLTINLHFLKNDVKKSTNDKLINKILQQRTQFQLMTGIIIFNLVGDDRETSINETLFTWSDSFIPLTYINVTYYKTIFEENPSLINLDIKKLLSPNKEITYQNCRKELNRNIKLNENGLSILSQLSFYKILYESNLLTFFLHDNIINQNDMVEKDINNLQIRVGGFTTPIAIKFYKKIKDNILNNLIVKPPIYFFIYAAILSSELHPKNQIVDEREKEFYDFLTNCWVFTIELVNGLRELAKNICEHSSNKRGVFCGRVYNGDADSEWIDDSGWLNFLRTYKKSLTHIDPLENNKLFHFFNINIIDDGQIGVVENLKNSISSSSVNYPEKENDLILFDNDKIKFQNLLDTSSGIILNQQTKRAYAHLGLLFFSKFIIHNNGIIRGDTWNKNKLEGKRDFAFVLKDSLRDFLSSFNVPRLNRFGTNYNIILPFDPTKPLKPYTSIYSTPNYTTAVEKQSLEDLFSFETVCFRSGEEPSILDKNKYIFIVAPKSIKMIEKNNEELFFKEITDSFLDDHKKLIQNKSAVVCIDLNEVSIDSSQLFRFLGRWELEFPTCSVILFNLSTDLLFRLIDINEIFYDMLKANVNVQYWDENSLAVIYSYTIAQNKFYFTDVLWGRNKEDFLLINRFLSKTNFNAYSIEHPINNSENVSLPEEYKHLLSRFSVFTNECSLLPIDLLIKDIENNLSLFEHNMSVLLNNDLNPIHREF